VAKSLKARRAELSAADPKLGRLIEQLGHRSPAQRRRGQPKPDAYGALLRTVVGQQISSKAARAIYTRLLDLYGGRTPSPEEILKTPEADLRGVGLSGRKVEYVRDLAAHVKNGELELDRLNQLSDEQVIEEIAAVRGFGRWSAEMFLIFHLERPDVLAGDDLGIRKAVQLLYGMDEMPKPKEVLEIGERWSPNRSLASIYLWESLAGDVTVGGV
jgi:DNA-3-methyladenine glycosylase II